MTHETQRAAALVEAFVTLVIKLQGADPAELTMALEFIRDHDGEESAQLLQELSTKVGSGSLP